MIAGKNVADVKIVLNGAGAAGIACLRLMTIYGVRKENILALDQRGIIFKGRTAGMNP